MKNTFSLFLLFISCTTFSQKELEISNKSKHKIYTPYIADDGSCAVSESYSGRQSIRTFDKKGIFLSEINFKGNIDLFDPQNKCWISSVQGAKKIQIFQIDFDGTITEVYRNSEKQYMKERVLINAKGNIEFYFRSSFGMMPYVCIEYNPKDKLTHVQDFSDIEIEKPASVVQTIFLGRFEDETYFVNWHINAFSGKTEVVVYAVDKKNQLRQVGNLNFEAKNTQEVFVRPMFIAPYLDNFNDDPIVFVVDFNTYEEKVSGRGSSKKFKSTYKIYRIEEDNKFSMLDLDPSHFRCLNGEFNMFVRTDESETTLLTFIEKNSGAVVFATDFDTPLEDLTPEIYNSLKVPGLIFKEKEYSELYEMVANGQKGIFRIGEDGIGRLIFIQDNKAFFGAK